MKAAILFTGAGPIAVLTDRPALNDPDVLRRLHAKGVDKFMAFELPLQRVRERYGPHFTAVVEDNKQDDDLRVLDADGGSIMEKFPFAEYGPAFTHEAGRG